MGFGAAIVGSGKGGRHFFIRSQETWIRFPVLAQAGVTFPKAAISRNGGEAWAVVVVVADQTKVAGRDREESWNCLEGAVPGPAI